MVSLISSLTEEDSKSNTVCGGVSTGGNITIDIKPDIKPTIINRIQVSDDETDSETESESEDDSEYSTTSSENENDCEILSEIEELNDILELEQEQDDECNVVDLEEESQVVVDEEEAIPYDIDTIKSIHLEQPTDFSIFKTINVIGEVVVSESDDATNYKKMSLSKLREIAQSQGHEDTSKLKKQELLKLLGAE